MRIVPSGIELYGTSCCPLCEEAQAILHDAGVVAKNIDKPCGARKGTISLIELM